MTFPDENGIMDAGTTVLSADPAKEDNEMDQQLITALYCRLSNEDDQEGESNSISNQRAILGKYAQDHGFLNPRYFVDDGYTGTNFDRPAMQELLTLVEAGQVRTIIVKDLSRFGREYLQVGQYLEIDFPMQNVRFIAINDGVDSAKGEDDFTPIRSLFNDFYAKDTSRKVRAVMQAKGRSGKHLNQAIYGYRDDPNTKGLWLIDEETAPVVRRMFDLTIAGKGTQQIAEILEGEKVLNPTAVSDIRRGMTPRKEPYRWNNNTVRMMLRHKEYAGYTVNFKTYSKSYKLKKRLPNSPENILEIPDTQEAIVPLAQWELAQELLDKKRRPAKRLERQGLFSGLVFCADCGSRLYFHDTTKGSKNRESYYCGKYSVGRGECTAHYIREKVLKSIVLEQIRYMTSYVAMETVDFADEWMRNQRRQQEKELYQAQKRLAQAEKRNDEIDDLLMRAYEDYAKGVLTLERYQKMSAKYEQEQAALKEEIATLVKNVRREEETTDNFDRFMDLLRRYVGSGIEELTPAMVNEFVKKIIVHEADNSTGKRVQQVEIVFNFIGDLDLPAVNQKITVTKGFNEKIA